MATAAPDFVDIGRREFGFDRPVYPIDEAFALLGIGRTYGYELVASGELETIHLAPRKTVVTATSMARLLHQRRLLAAVWHDRIVPRYCTCIP
jgi:hypothetical protein